MEESYIEWLVKRKDPIYALPGKDHYGACLRLFRTAGAADGDRSCDHDSSRYRYLFYFPEFKCGI